MPELVVDPADLVRVARPLAEIADRLGAVAASLRASPGPVGPDDLVHALEDSGHVWRSALRGSAAAVALASEQLVSAASGYDAVEALVGEWAGG